MEVSPEKLNLEYGDIIQIEAPENDSIHEHIYLIDYIDNTLIRLIDDKDLITVTLNIENGTLTDETIKSISILDKPIEKGYIKQNNLEKDSWIELHFSGDVPAIITGKITDIIEDMIEVEALPNKEKIYIDFAYKGIPLSYPITKINIRSEPPLETLKEESLTEEPSETKTDVAVSKSLDEPDVSLTVKQSDVREKIQNVLAEADIFSFGDDVETITQEVEIADEEKRFTIDVQTNDLLDEMLSTIPNIERSERVLNNINIMINRFKELREQYSSFNANGQIEAIIKKGTNYKPLVDKLHNFSHNLYWLLPVVKNKKKLYNVDVLREEDDIEIMDIGANLETMQTIEQEYKDNSISGSNKYSQLIKSLNPYYTPYVSQSDTEDLLSENSVHSNINVVINNIVDNLQEFYTNVSDNDKMRRERFVITKYNLGLNRLETVMTTGTTFENRQAPLTMSDKVPLSSIMFLPEPFVRYSHINLPSTSIYDKTNLNHVGISYWKLLRKQTSVTSKIVNSLEKEIEYDGGDFLQTIKNIALAEGISEDDKYRKFLQAVIPRTRNLFELIKKYIKKGTNVKDVISYLEPFMIYREDLSFKQYQDISDFINTNVLRIKQLSVSNKKEANILASFKSRIIVGTPLLLSIQGKDSLNISTLYSLQDKTNSEIYKDVMTSDYGEYYMNVLSLLDKDLFSNIDVEAQITDTIKVIEENMDKEIDSKGICDYVLSKKYISHDELSEDNGKPEIYFDKKYDQTPYDIIFEYKEQRESMEPEEFASFLQEKLMENIGLNKDKAKRDADTMIMGKKKVLDGDYALLEIYDEEGQLTRTYYKRSGNNWEYDETVTKNANTDEQRMFCNVKSGCIQLKADCDSVEETKNKIMKENMEKLVDTMSDETNEEREKLIRDITKKTQLLSIRLQKIMNLRREQILRNNNKLYTLGLTLDDSDVLVSPYSELMSLILGTQDLQKRSMYIIRFVNTHTRPPLPGSDESPYWLYCPISNVKLMPSFFYELAEAYGYGPEEYRQKLDTICDLRGDLSDDGDKWVDKYSGYTIKERDFDVEEGFDETGRRIVSRELLDEDYVVRDGDEKEDTELNSSEALTSKKILSALSFYTGIQMKEQMSFVVKEAVKAATKQMPTRERYASQVERAAKKGKKMPSYQKKQNQLIIYFTSLYFLLVIQTSIPGLKTRKTFPGCTKDFSGYPLIKETYGGITYVACVLKNISSSQQPWDSIKGIREDALKRNLMTIYDKIMDKDASVQKLIQEKQLFILENGEEDDIPDEVNVSNWNTFLPPLKKTDQGTVRNVSDAFINELMDDLKKGKKQQYEKLAVIKGKMISYSLKLIEEIQNIVRKEPALLETMGGEPFLQNVCCNDLEQLNTLGYFNEKNSEIMNHNKKVHELSKIYIDTITLANSPVLMSNQDTKRKYPTLSNTFSEETIYKAFIYYCNYTKDLPVRESLKILCTDNSLDIKSIDGIKERIEFMKSNGLLYNDETLLHLLKLISRENYINIDFEGNVYNNKESILNLIENADALDHSMDDTLLGLMKETIETYDDIEKKHSTKQRELRNKMITDTETMKQKIIDFLTKYSSVSSSLKRRLLTLVKEFDSFSLSDDTNGLLTKEEHSIMKMVGFIKNSIVDMIEVYPSIIYNEIDYSNVKPPAHWKLSQIHNNDITKFIKKDYAQLAGLYGNKEIKNLMGLLMDTSSVLTKLVNETFFTASLQVEGKSSLFEFYFMKELYLYLFYYTLHYYIDLQDSEDVLLDVVELGTSVQDELVEVDIASGDTLKIKQEIARVLMSYLEIIERQKKRVDMNKERIMELVLRSKEKEKNTKVRQLTELTDEERSADNELRRAKLGKWGVGLQKGLTQYVKDTYDQERGMLESEALMDLQLGQLDVVNDMNRDIFALEELEKKIAEKEADAEGNDISALPDDDDYGELDGDEGY